MASSAFEAASASPSPKPSATPQSAARSPLPTTASPWGPRLGKPRSPAVRSGAGPGEGRPSTRMPSPTTAGGCTPHHDTAGSGKSSTAGTTPPTGCWTPPVPSADRHQQGPRTGPPARGPSPWCPGRIRTCDTRLRRGTGSLPGGARRCHAVLFPWSRWHREPLDPAHAALCRAVRSRIARALPVAGRNPSLAQTAPDEESEAGREPSPWR